LIINNGKAVVVACLRQFCQGRNELGYWRTVVKKIFGRNKVGVDGNGETIA
jgi:hypothetical protein